MADDYAAMMLSMPMFHGFTRSGAQRLIDLGRITEHAPGEQFCKEGDPAEYVLLVLSGKLRVYIERGGAELVVADFGPGVILGDIAILCGIRRAASARALEPTAALQWTDKAFRALMLKDLLLSHRIFGSSFRTLIEREKSLIESLEQRQLAGQSR